MTLPYMLVALVLALVGGWGVFLYNRLVRGRHTVDAGWSDIGVQLQRRHDLIPKLVDAVKAYASYEQATLTAITELRTQSERATEPSRIAEIETQLRAGLDRLIAVAEDYPDLKASQQFIGLQRELSNVEDKLQYARRFYNGAVRIYNTRIDSFPDVYFARTMGFSAAQYFEPDDAAQHDSSLRFD